MDKIQKQLDELIRDFERLSKMISRLDIEIRADLDMHVEDVDAETGLPAFFATLSETSTRASPTRSITRQCCSPWRFRL